jgi:hypothetical protein
VSRCRSMMIPFIKTGIITSDQMHGSIEFSDRA